MRIIGTDLIWTGNLLPPLGEKQLKYLGERISIMNEGLIVTLLIVNIALSGAALLGIFVVLGMLKGKEE
jgi:hypothetical protein